MERCELIESYLPLARSCASRYANRGVSRDDLFQVACVGLVKAVDGFDPEAGHEFVSYAVPTIRGELRRYFRDHGWMVRPPRRIQELQPRIRAATDQLGQDLRRSPTDAEIASVAGAKVSDIREARASAGCFQPTSLDTPLPSGEGTLGQDLGGEDLDLAWVEDRITLANAVHQLPRRDRMILKLRFVDGLTQQAIGERIGVTQMQVSRIQSRILAQLRTQLTAS